jgi:hypothetical protein
VLESRIGTQRIIDRRRLEARETIRVHAIALFDALSSPVLLLPHGSR